MYQSIIKSYFLKSNLFKISKISVLKKTPYHLTITFDKLIKDIYHKKPIHKLTKVK